MAACCHGAMTVITSYSIHYTKLYDPEYKITEEEVDVELARFTAAIDKTREELKQLKLSINKESSINEAGFLDAHILMLDDPELSKLITKKITEEHHNAEWALYAVIKQYIDLLQSSNDEYIRERSFDLRDVARRVLGNLLYKKRVDLTHLTEEIIVITSYSIHYTKLYERLVILLFSKMNLK